MEQQALSGLRVIAAGNHPAGRFAASMLAGHGADIVHVEEAQAAGPVARASFGLDLADPVARDWLLQMVRRADFLVDGLAPAALERNGLGWETLSHENRGLILLRAWPCTPPEVDSGLAATGLVLRGLMLLHQRHRTGAGGIIAPAA